MLNAQTWGARHRLAVAAVMVAVVLGLLTLTNAQAATDMPSEIGGQTGSNSVAELAAPAHGSCIGEFAVISAAVTGGGFGGFEPILPRTDHHVYPDANGNCPDGYTKHSVYECHYDDNYVITCSWVDRCYQSHSG